MIEGGSGRLWGGRWAAGGRGFSVHFLKPRACVTLMVRVLTPRVCPRTRALGVRARPPAALWKTPARPGGRSPAPPAGSQVVSTPQVPGPALSEPQVTPELAAAPGTLAVGARQPAGLQQARRDREASGAAGGHQARARRGQGGGGQRWQTGPWPQQSTSAKARASGQGSDDTQLSS